MSIEAKTVDELLNEVDYSFPNYVPSKAAVKFITFIKLVNAERGGEENKSPIVHMKMLDAFFTKKKRTAIMCHRGISKTSLMAEYMFLYLAVFGKIDGFGEIDIAIYVSDSIENGVKNLRKNVEYRYDNSDFLKENIPKIKFTDTRLEFVNKNGKKFIVKCYGGKALSLDSKLYTNNGFVTMGECKVGDNIFAPDGKETTIIQKSEIFNKPMYKIKLLDGREIKVSEDHINSVQINTNPNNSTRWEDFDLTTKELLEIPLSMKSGNSSKGIVAIKNTLPVEYEEKELPLEPYLLGLLLGDGSMKKDGSNVLHAHKDDMEFYKEHIDHQFGSEYVDKRNTNVVSLTIRGISSIVRELGVNVHGNEKFVPIIYQRGSIEQRISILQGLMDTDGTISKTGRMSFSSNSKLLAEGVAELVRSLGGEARVRLKNNRHYYVEIKILINIFRLPRKCERYKDRVRTTNRVPIVSIDRIEDEPSQCIAVDNELKQFLTDNYIRTHNTGVRGSKEQGKRPQLAVLDDLISDDDARSPTIISTIEDTVHKAVSKALHPTYSKTVWLGTPFNQSDPLYKAVESGAWEVAVYPMAEEFNANTTRETYKPAWGDRFDYDYAKDEYDSAAKQGKLDGFYQEMMLRVVSEEERIIKEEDIVMYDYMLIKDRIDTLNVYITTDFATSEKKHSDPSAISVWGVNSNNDYLWLDGMNKRQLMGQNVEKLFRLVQIYKPMAVGIEVTGQQNGFVDWIRGEMIKRQVYFNIVELRPNRSKLERAIAFQPRFNMKKIHYPKNHMSEIVDEHKAQLRSITMSGIKAKHDDCIDTVTAMANMEVIAPSTEGEARYNTLLAQWELKTDIEDSVNSYLID